MTSGDLLEIFRDEMDDRVEPYLWSDDLCYGYINDAQQMFYRLTDGIPDGTTPEVTLLSIEPATEWYATHPSILKIRDAYRVDTGAPVTIYNQEDMASYGLRFNGRPGPLRALVIGIEDFKARAWPVPNETVDIQLTVFRLPLVDVVDDQPLNVADQHQVHLLLWVKHRAYSKQNAETFDRTRAKEFDEAFRTYCKAAKDEQRRAKHKPRAVLYGGL